MKRIKLISALLLISCFTFWFCQKKLFGRIEVKGRLLHFYTNQPIKETVELMGDDVTSAKNSTEHSISLAKGNSKDDGTFDLKSNLSRRNNYYLYVGGRAWDWKKQESSINVKEHQTNNLGDLFLGTHTFYCRINIHGLSDSLITFYTNTPNGSDLTFNPVINTQFLDYTVYYYDDYEDNNHNYLLQYTKTYGGKGVDYILRIPIVNSDTLYTTINY